MKILKSEKEKLLNWVNNGKSVYWLHDYLVNTCGYGQLNAKEIIDNIDTIEVFDNDSSIEYNIFQDKDGYWYIEEYKHSNMTNGVMGNSVPHCYSQMFDN